MIWEAIDDQSFFFLFFLFFVWIGFWLSRHHLTTNHKAASHEMKMYHSGFLSPLASSFVSSIFFFRESILFFFTLPVPRATRSIGLHLPPPHERYMDKHSSRTPAVAHHIVTGPQRRPPTFDHLNRKLKKKWNSIYMYWTAASSEVTTAACHDTVSNVDQERACSPAHPHCTRVSCMSHFYCFSNYLMVIYIR